MISRLSTVSLTALAIGLIGSCTANAEPPEFPDIKSYKPVDVQEYTISLPNTGSEPIDFVYFQTPDGLLCSFLSGEAGCTGDNIPGVSAKDKNPYTDIGTDSGIKPMGSTPFINGRVQGHEVKVLPALHSITVDGSTCGVDDKGTTACRDSHQRGFVISPHGTAWFPHIQ